MVRVELLTYIWNGFQPDKWKHYVWIVIETDKEELPINSFIIDKTISNTTTQVIEDYFNGPTYNKAITPKMIYIIDDPSNGSMINGFFKQILRDRVLNMIC